MKSPGQHNSLDVSQVEWHLLYPKYSNDLHLQIFQQKVTDPVSAYYRPESFLILLKLIGDLNTLIHTLFYNETIVISLQVCFSYENTSDEKKGVICFHAGLT